MQSEYKRKSGIALGISVISLLFLVETFVADHHMPNAASPIVWSVLGLVAAIGLFCAWWYRRKANAGTG